MRTLPILALALVLIVLTGCTAEAQSKIFPELIVTVPQTKRAKFTRPENFSLREKLYFSKRHRIAQVNFAALGTVGSVFTMSLFPDLQLTLQTTELTSDGTQHHWRGKILEMREKNKLLALDDLPERRRELDFIYTRIFPEISAELKRELDADGQQGFVTDDVLVPAQKASPPRIGVQVVGAYLLLPFKPYPFMISELDEDPRYHVIYEEDLDKRPTGRDAAEKERNLREFHQSLQTERQQHEQQKQSQ